MDSEWCAEVFSEAIELHGKPGIINTDQGSQYTSDIFVSTVFKEGVALSMDGKGRATDNAFVERLWRSVKYEKVYLNPAEDGIDLNRQLVEYFDFYNHERRHSSLAQEVPSQVYRSVGFPFLVQFKSIKNTFHFKVLFYCSWARWSGAEPSPRTVSLFLFLKSIGLIPPKASCGLYKL
jgi:hypothetical protein